MTGSKRDECDRRVDPADGGTDEERLVSTHE